MPKRHAWLHALWRACATTIVLWVRRAVSRQELRELNARLLDDIGCTELERQRECAKWFWHA